MSLAIDVDSVIEVLLPDGEWHQVANGSFEIDAYEYLRASEFEVGGGDKGMRFKGGQEEHLVPAAGARWLERNSQGNVRTVSCPITAIRAVSNGWSTGKKSN